MHRWRKPIKPLLQTFLEVKVERLLSPLDSFIHKQTASALLLLVSILAALFIANCDWGRALDDFTAIETGVVFHGSQFLLPLKEWVSSGFMALFFFLIGLELKRETLAGTLRDSQQIPVIVMAALGGMIFPAVIYYALNHGTVGVHGWAIPMATDTAFSLGALSVLMSRVSYGVSVFLAAMAIFDDIGAIAVISIFYTHHINAEPLAGAILVLGLLFFINLAGVRNGWAYAALGVALWAFIFNSGIHATLAGLLMAVTVPARTRLGEVDFVEEVRALLSVFERKQDGEKGILGTPEQHRVAVDIEATVKAVSTPLQRWETYLAGPIGMVILPVFALFNAGVAISADVMSSALTSPVTLGILLGLVVGKPLGVTVMVLLGLYFRVGRLPEGMSISEVVGVGLLAGIGFTMSLFITTLSFGHRQDLLDLVDNAKVGILGASVISTAAAFLWICLTHGARKKKEGEAT